MKSQKILNKSIIILILLIFVLTGCQAEESKEIDGKRDKLKVKVALATKKLIKDKIEITGTLYPYEEVVISNKIPGKITAIYAELGDYIKKGQLLAKIDPIDYELQSKEATARILALETSLEGIDKSDKLFESHTQIREAKANLDNAYLLMTRKENLAKKKLIPEQDYDSAKATYLEAKARYDAVEFALKKIEAELSVLEATKKMISQKITETKIISPISGYVKKRTISQGEYLQVEEPAFTIVQINTLKLKTFVPEKYYLNIKKGQKVDFSVISNPEKNYSGLITRIAPSIDEKTRTFEVEIIVKNNNLELKPGLFANLIINLGTEHERLFVPESSVYSVIGINKVFIVKDGKTKEYLVELGKTKDGKIEIINNIQEGAKVITTSVDKLTDGIEVQIINESE